MRTWIDSAITLLCAGDRSRRHNAVRNWLHKLADLAMLNPRLEQNCLNDGTKSRPADVYIDSFTNGRPLAVDTTVFTPFSPHLVSNAAVKPLHTASEAEKIKRAKYEAACDQRGIKFVPFAVETTGGLGKVALDLAKDLLGRVSKRFNQPFPTVAHYYYQQLSVSLQRQVARSVVDRIEQL